MYFITGDEHLGHKNILKYCNRPFSSIEEMDEEIIKRHNKVVSKEDTVIHAGDFTLMPSLREVQLKYVSKLNGAHIFLKGSHDRWLNGLNVHQIWERKIGENYIVVCHYAMRRWPRSHYGSILCYGHSHGELESLGKSMDVGVDTNNFYPYSLDKIVEVMKSKPSSEINRKK
jgi:calcineurin-like phosphoesterase family protein